MDIPNGDADERIVYINQSPEEMFGFEVKVGNLQPRDIFNTIGLDESHRDTMQTEVKN